MKPLKVLVVDDSSLARDLVITALSRTPHIDVVGSAADPLLARRQIALHTPDVLTLDVEMPRMDGLAFLDQLMRLHPLPVVMVSSLTGHGSEGAVRALAGGAVDVVGKPTGLDRSFDSLASELCSKVLLAGQAQIRPLRRQAMPALALPLLPDIAQSLACAVVGGLGSLPAMLDIAAGWPPDAPALLLAPSISSISPLALAGALGQRTAQPVRLGEDGLALRPGEIVVIPSDQPLIVEPVHSGGYAFKTSHAAAPDLPPGDRLLSSLAQAAQANAVALLLSGESTDGAKGLTAIAEAGGCPLVQDRCSAMFSTNSAAALRLSPLLPVIPLAQSLARLLSACQQRVPQTPLLYPAASAASLSDKE